MIVDCFPFFAPYGEELLYLRVNLLKDHVDKFIIVESNKTHNGQPVERKFMEIARKQGLPIEKIIYVEHDIPETEDLVIQDIDKRNAGPSQDNVESLYARARERMQKDAVMSVFDQFNDDDIFIYGDSDEIIDPKNINWIANIVKNNQDVIIKVPLVYLQGRADLRCYDKNTNRPTIWMRAMFFATKSEIIKNTINNIRCGNVHSRISFPSHANVVAQDLGWHFAWMGTGEQRKIKADSFAHANDRLMSDGKEMGFSEFYESINYKFPLAEDEPAPDGHYNHILKNYPLADLPQLIFETPFVKKFLLPELDIKEEYSFNKCKCYWCEKLQWPLLYDLNDDEEKVWFEIPRSCSVTIKESFPARKQVFRNTEKYDNLTNGSKKPIVIFTDPVERFVSLINAYITRNQRYYHYGNNIFCSLGKDLEQCTKQEKIDLFFKNLPKLTSNHQVHHFYPQVNFVDMKNFDEFQVVKKHDLSEFFGIEEKMNVTHKDITAEDFSEDQIDFIKRVYAKDYEFFEKYGVKDAKSKTKRKRD